MAGRQDIGKGNARYENVVVLGVQYTFANFDESDCDESIPDFGHDDTHIFHQPTVDGKIAKQSVDSIHLHSQGV